MKYDLIIPSHPKDYVKLQFCLNSCLEHLNPSPENIYVITPDGLGGSVATGIKDEDAIQINKATIKYRRSNWIYQQLVKLFQDFTENDLYLCVDSDLIFNRSIDIFKDDKPNFFVSDRDQHHEPYFNFMDLYFGLSRQVDHTFINDFMIFDKNICSEMIPDKDHLALAINETMSDDCLLSEFETYGNYITKNHPNLYGSQLTKTKMYGRYSSEPWSGEEIKQIVDENRTEDVDLFTIHSWT